MDKSTAITLALNKLGERHYVEKSATHAPIQEHWKLALSYASAVHPWTFTRSITTLTPRTSGTSGTLLTYDYPPDALSIIQLTDSSNRRITWRPYADRTLITVNAPTDHPTCIYNNNSLTSSETLPDSDPAFINFFLALLASYIAPCILGGEQGISVSQALMQEAMAHLAEARTRDTQQWASNDDAHPLRTYLNLNSSVRL